MYCAFERITGSDTIVLCVHGIQGSPSQFLNLTEKIPARIDYMCVLLSGHSASVKEFAKAGYVEWLQFVPKTISDLSKQYRRITYVGHSMGCLLGILAAVSGMEKLHGMMLLACLLRLRLTIRYALNNWKSVVQQSPSDLWVKAAKEANSIAASHSFEYLMCMKPYLGLLKLISMTKCADYCHSVG